MSRSPHRPTGVERRAAVLGWLSLGLGAAQLLAPRQVARLIGASDDDGTRLTLRAVGLREVVCGLGLLSKTSPEAWAWARVAGDVMDLALLGNSLRSDDAEAPQVLGAAGGVLGVAYVDTQTALELSRNRQRAMAEGIRVTRTITVNRSQQQVYEFWRDLENLPRFMAHLESVKVKNGRSRWRARGPLGTHIEWDAEVTEDRPNELISWRSVAGSDVPNQGSVRFRASPGGRGTEIVVQLSYDPPAGALGHSLAKLFGEEPGQQIAGDLRRLKQVLETGEIMRSDASIHSGMHPARPAKLGAKAPGDLPNGVSSSNVTSNRRVIS